MSQTGRGHENSKSPLHQEFNSCGFVMSMRRQTPLGEDELRAMARELMLAVTEKTRIAGAVEVGHIKAVMESGGGIIYANTVGDPSDITVKGGGLGSPSMELKLTLNSVILGLSGDEAASAAREAAEVWAGIYGLKVNSKE
ncbi:MAG: hypothetical protein OEV92_03210 [Nitrospinota bacterium]|nr:hypothetical protein [Nitrospinota bacterium]